MPMHTTAPEPRSLEAATILTGLLGPWRTFARAHGLPRPDDKGAQPPPVGLLSALVAPVFTTRWMGTQDPSMLVPPPPALSMQEDRAAALDPSLPLQVDLTQDAAHQWTARLTQDGHAVGSVSLVWRD